MHVDEIDTSEYTHIHFAFANVTRGDFKVELTDPSVKEQFEIFKRMKNIKKIVSLGGWAFSTEPGSFSVLREAVLPANREKFKNNLISFMNDHDLDGIDLDWEYPGVSIRLDFITCSRANKTLLRLPTYRVYRVTTR